MNPDVALALVLVGLCCWGWGYNRGIEDTEKRWSDAVAKDEWHKKYGSH